MEEEHEAYRDFLERIVTKHPEWEGKVLSYKHKGGGKATNLDSFRLTIEWYDRDCTE